jgi:glyoxylase I family protein
LETSSRPLGLERIEHVLLLVDEMRASLEFYEGVLGARVESHLPQHAMVELRVGDSHLDLVDTTAPEGAWARPPVEGGRNVDHIAICVDAPDDRALRDYLAAHGVAIVEERVEHDAGGERLSIYVRDPSGNVVELMGVRFGE